MKKITLLIAVPFLWACSPDADDEASAPATVGEEIAGGYNDALDKARAVEDQVMEQKRKLDEAVEEIE